MMPENDRPRSGLPCVAVLGTGGTIAGAYTCDSTTDYVAGAFSIEFLLAAVPQLGSIATLRAEQLANVGSQDMRHDIWHALATRIAALRGDTDVDGIVVTHGTDTLEETAYFLDRVLPAGKPVILTGAMRPATALGADGPANLYAAVALAAHPLARDRGVLVLMNEDIHEAAGVQKIAAAGVAAFASPDRGPAGVMQDDRPWFYRVAGSRSQAGWPMCGAPLPDPAQWPRVGVVHAHADMQADVIEFMATRYDGLVLAGVGNGNATAAAMHALAHAAAQGVAVVRASRTGRGQVARNVEVDDDGLGFIAGGGLNPQKARVLLMLALMSTNDRTALQACFDAA
jgi:L-asparaginase